MATLGIISALAEEQQGLLERLEQPVCVKRAGREFWQGSYRGHRLVIGLSRIGKVAAATTATALIEAFGIHALVFTGVAGGLRQGVNVGDVVVATEFVQHDMDASPLFPRFEIPLYQQTRMVCDATLTSSLLHAAKQAVSLINQPLAMTELPSQRSAHCGLIASGDRFVSSVVESQVLQAKLLEAGIDAFAVEMEGAAVAQVCLDYGIPFGAVRTISDRADDTAHMDFSLFIREVASPYAMAILDEFLKNYPSNQ